MSRPFLADYALWCEVEDIKSSVADKSKIGPRGYGNPGVDKGRILDREVFESLGDVLEHIDD